MVLLHDSLVGFEINTPHFEQLFAPLLIQNMAACEAWSAGRTRFSYLLPFCVSLPFFLFMCVVSFFICVVSFLCAWFLFSFAFYFLFAWFLFLFACFLFYFLVIFLFAGFLFCLCGFFFVCSVSLVGHR